MYEIERLKIRIDDLMMHMTASVTALQRISEILQEVLAVEDPSASLQNIGCPGAVLIPLRAVGITTVQQVTQRTGDELLSIRNFGQTKLNYLQQCLAAKGYKLKADNVGVSDGAESVH